MLVWMDLEMTGLDPTRHVIIEIATLVTDDQLEVTAEGPDLVIAADEAQLAHMGDFVRQMHTSSGLLDQVRTSRLTTAEAERATIDFLAGQGIEKGAVPLAGNSIGTDRRFLQTYMPELEAFFHYRNVDVSSVKELAQRWYPAALAARPDKAAAHRALDDVRESIEELRYYRRTIFVAPPPGN